MDFFGLEPEIAALRGRLAQAEGAARIGLSAQLAWYLRERDTREALDLVDEGLALIAEGATEDHAERLRCEARFMLVRAHGLALFAQFDAADISVATARRGYEAADDQIGLGDTCMVDAAIAALCGQGLRADEASRAADVHYAAAGDAVRRNIREAWQVREEGLRETGPVLARWTAAPPDDAACSHPGWRAMLDAFHGRNHWKKDHHAAAIENYRRARAGMRASGQVRLEIVLGLNSGCTYVRMLDFDRAFDCLEQAAAQARRTGWPASIGASLMQFAVTLWQRGRTEAARDLLQEAVAVLQPLKETRNWAVCCGYLGGVLVDLGDAQQALHWLDESEIVARKQGSMEVVASTLRRKGSALSLLGRSAAAVASVREAFDIEVANHWLSQQIESLLALSDIVERHAPNQAEAARSALPYLQQAQSLQLESDRSAHVEVLRRMARHHEALGDPVQALSLERQAFDIHDLSHTERSARLESSFLARTQTERVQADAEHQRALADAEGRRADAEARANRAKSTFLANMSHELRSPLNAMLGFSRLLLRDRTLGDGARHDVGIVLASGEHLYGLINQVLELSKIEAGCLVLNPMPFDIHSLLQELRSMFEASARQKGLRLAIEASPSVPQHLVADAVKLRQVLINLLSNALKFTPHGAIELQVKEIDGARLGFKVVDTGVGISSDELAGLGEAFAQAHAGRHASEGTGLGLAISRSFVRLMGGELALASEPRQGTTVHFDIPLQAARPGEWVTAFRPPTLPARRLAAGTPTPRILAVDDRPESRHLLVRLLTPLGFEVREAANGQEAIDAWRQWQPQLILMDMRMPVLDGREATQRIRAAEGDARTCIVALTASSFEEERAEILAHGCDDFLRKPFREGDLLDLLARHLGLRYDHEAAPAPPVCATEPKIDVSRMPAPLREQLRSALARLDVQAVARALEALHAHDAPTAELIEPIIERFDYDRARALLADEPASC